jgi:hypothetical protein
MRILKIGNNNSKRLAQTALVRPILEYGAVCWDPYREGAVCWDPYRRQVNASNRMQKRAAKFANNINESGWETGTTKTDSPNMRPLQGKNRGTGLESDREYPSKTMLS